MSEESPARLRVAAIIDTSIVSGPGRQLAAVAGALPALDVDLKVFTFQRAGREPSPYPAYLNAAGVAAEVIPERGTGDVSVVRRLRSALRDFTPDVVQTHSYRPAALAAALRVLGADWPWIAFFHGTTSEDTKVRVYNWVDRRMLRFADRIVVMSRAHQASFTRYGDRVRLIHNAVVQLPGAIPEPAVSPPTSALPRPVVGYIGRLSHEKGVDLLLEAARLLSDRGVPFSLAIIGDGPEHASLERIARELGIEEQVHFLGTIDPIAPVYRELDVVVLPSRSEGLPNVLLEALAANRPVVATRVGAVPEVLENADAGELIDPGSAQAVADGIARALDRRADPAGTMARRSVVARFSLERRAALHRELYDEIAGRRRRKAG